MKTILLFLCIFSGSASFAQTGAGDITGSFYDGMVNEPAPFAQVQAISTDSTYVTETDIDGRFHFSDIPDGSYTLTFKFDTKVFESDSPFEVKPDLVTFAGQLKSPDNEPEIIGCDFGNEFTRLHLKQGVSPETKITREDIRRSPIR